MEKIIKIAIADDHVLLRSALSSLINSFGNCKVIFEANNGLDVLTNMKAGIVPDVLLLDLSMKEMDGYETAAWVQANKPNVHILMLTMYDAELTLLRLLQLGVKGFLKKDIEPSELKFAIQSVMQSGYYYSSTTTGRLVNLFRNSIRENMSFENITFTDQELAFLQLACTDLTYKEVAQRMGLNPRSVDNLRDHMFNKLSVKSRVGLAMVAIRNGIVALQA